MDCCTALESIGLGYLFVGHLIIVWYQACMVVVRTIQYALSKEDGTKDNERSYYGIVFILHTELILDSP